MIKSMGKVPSLGGKPSMQAMMGATGSISQPQRSPGKPGKAIKGLPASKGSTQTAKQPKGKAQAVLKKGNIKGITKKAVANVKGGT